MKYVILYDINKSIQNLDTSSLKSMSLSILLYCTIMYFYID